MLTHIIQRRNKRTERLNDLPINGREIRKTSGTEGKRAKCLADVVTPSTSFLIPVCCRARTASSAHRSVRAQRRPLMSRNGGACAGSLVSLLNSEKAALPKGNGENQSREPVSLSLNQLGRLGF